jgi:hypothetical protein
VIEPLLNTLRPTLRTDDNGPPAKDEFLMSIRTRIAVAALATLAVTGTIASTTQSAEAKGFGWGWGVGAGLVGAAVVGSAIAASNDGYYYDSGYRHCFWVRQYNAYGDYLGRVRSCNY